MHSTPPTNTPIDTKRRRFLSVAAGGAVAAAIPTTVATTAAAGADAELIALGKKLESLVDAYYAARQLWARALVQRNSELDERFANEIDDRVGLDVAADQLHVVFEKVEPIARAIEALPCTSIEGLRAKVLVAFWEVAPLCADNTEFHFEDAYPFQQLFCAVAEVCGLNSKIASTGFDMPAMYSDDDGEEA